MPQDSKKIAGNLLYSVHKHHLQKNTSQFVILAVDEGDSEGSLTQIRAGALEKLKVLKEELCLEDEFDDLDFGGESS